MLPSGHPLILAEDFNGADGGAVVWDAAWPLAEWLYQSSTLDSITSAIELGSGNGLVAVAVRLAGVPRVVATDHCQALCDLCVRNGELNGAPLIAIRHEWGDDNSVDAMIAACGGSEPSEYDQPDEGCPEVGRSGWPRRRLILMSDVYYHNDHSPKGGGLERSVRALIRRGGCAMVVASWKTRTFKEEGFLGKLRDLGLLLPTVHLPNGVCVGALQLHG